MKQLMQVLSIYMSKLTNFESVLPAMYADYLPDSSQPPMIEQRMWNWSTFLLVYKWRSMVPWCKKSELKILCQNLFIVEIKFPRKNRKTNVYPSSCYAPSKFNPCPTDNIYRSFCCLGCTCTGLKFWSSMYNACNHPFCVRKCRTDEIGHSIESCNRIV